MRINTIIFDLGGVYFTDGTKEAIDKISAIYKIDKQLVTTVFHGEIGVEFRKGNIEFEEVCARAKEYWKCPDINHEIIFEIWLSGYTPIQGTVEIINQLRKSGYRLLYLSGNTPDRVNYLDSKYHFLCKFDDGVFSYSMNAYKTDASLYKMLLEKTNTAPESCIYIDDKDEILLLAKASGMNTIHFTSPENLRIELRSFSISV